MIPLTTSLCITVPEASPDTKERSTSCSYHVSSMKVALSTPPSLMINPTFALLLRLLGLIDKGKRPCLPTLTPLDTESSDSPSPTPHQGVENDLVNNYTLDPIPYMNQLPPIE
ncbi:hypothetical protein Tco_1483671 [Tanacetum coccineum]